MRILASLLLILSFSFIWARFVERNLIVVEEEVVEVGFEGRVALIGDLHLGPYKSESFLARVVERINGLDVDMVLIAGDLTYEPDAEDLSGLFAPLKNLKFPVYAVLGNHDVGFPGPPIRDELVEVLEMNGVVVLENEVVDLGGFTLLGLGSHFAGEDEVGLLNNFSFEDNVVVLAHNPDSTTYFPNQNADLTLVGHTHAGQVRLPWVYKSVIPTQGDFDDGFTREINTKLFITSGLGETGLPMRLFNFPVVSVLEFR